MPYNKLVPQNFNHNQQAKLNKRKLKCSLCLISSAPRHEDVGGREIIASRFLTPALIEDDSQFRAPAALSPGREPSVPTGY